MLLAERGVIVNEAQPGNGSPGGGMPAGTLNGQLLWFQLASGLWVPSTTGPTAAGQVPTWSGSEYTFKGVPWEVYYSAYLNNSNSERWLYPGGYTSTGGAIYTTSQPGSVVRSLAGVITRYSWRFRIAASAVANATVRIYVNSVLQASFGVALGIQAASGALSIPYAADDRISVSMQNDAIDAASTAPWCTLSGEYT